MAHQNNHRQNKLERQPTLPEAKSKATSLPATPPEEWDSYDVSIREEFRKAEAYLDKRFGTVSEG